MAASTGRRWPLTVVVPPRVSRSAAAGPHSSLRGHHPRAGRARGQSQRERPAWSRAAAGRDRARHRPFPAETRIRRRSARRGRSAAGSAVHCIGSDRETAPVNQDATW